MKKENIYMSERGRVAPPPIALALVIFLGYEKVSVLLDPVSACLDLLACNLA